MTVRLTIVERDDVQPLMRLNLAADQDDFVAPNAVTLAQVAYEPNATAYCIWQGDTRVGLIAMIDCRDYPHLDDGDDPNSMYVWRLMIAKEHQRKGYGRAAMGHIVRIAKELGLPRISIAAVPSNEAAIGLYEKLGFHKTGRIIEGEIELSLKL